ncbi:unnamed protein product [Closterium sp. NIES-53]
MFHTTAPHFLWPFAVRYTAHQLNLWPCVSLPETSPTLRWTGKVGDASVFWVWGSCAFVCDTSADKLSARAIPCVFLGFVRDTPGWQFYHPTSRRVLPSRNVTFNESVPFYRLFPYRSAPPPPPPIFLAPDPPPVDPLPPQGRAPSDVSQVDPLSGTAPIQVAVGSGAAPGAASRGAEPGVAGSEGAGFRGAEPGGAELEGVERGGAESEGAESGGAEPRVPGAGGAGDTGAGGVAVTTGAGGTGGTTATSPGGAFTKSAAAAEIGGVGCAGAGDPMELGAYGGGGAGAGGAGVGGLGAGGAGAAGDGAVDPGPGGAGGTVRQRPYFVPLLHQPASPLPAPSPYTEHPGGLTERRVPASRPLSLVHTAPRTPRSRPPPIPGTHAMALHPSSVPLRVPLPAPSESSLPSLTLRLTALVLPVPLSLDWQEDFDCLAAAVPRFASMLLAPEGDPDAPDIPTPRSYAQAITGPYSSQWQAAMDAEMASWKSTGTYVDEVPSSRANIVDGMWIFRVKRLSGSPPAFKARYVARGFSQRHGVDYLQTFSPTPKMTTLRVLLVAAQRDYELHSLDFSTAFLHGSLHEEIWLRQPPGFTGTTTVVALGFAPSNADPSLFLRPDMSLPPFYVLVYIDDLVFATADTEAMTLVKSELQKRHTCTDLGELCSYLGLQITRDRARRTITLTQSHMVH